MLTFSESAADYRKNTAQLSLYHELKFTGLWGPSKKRKAVLQNQKLLSVRQRNQQQFHVDILQQTLTGSP